MLRLKIRINLDQILLTLNLRAILYIAIFVIMSCDAYISLLDMKDLIQDVHYNVFHYFVYSYNSLPETKIYRGISKFRYQITKGMKN